MALATNSETETDVKVEGEPKESNEGHLEQMLELYTTRFLADTEKLLKKAEVRIRYKSRDGAWNTFLTGVKLNYKGAANFEAILTSTKTKLDEIVASLDTKTA